MRNIPDRFSLATLLIVATVVAIAVGMPKFLLAVLASAPFVAVGAAAVVAGVRTRRYHVAVRLLSTGFGLLSIAVGAWVLWATLPR